MTLKEIRKNCKLTQKEASDIIGMPLRTYVSYETKEKEVDQIKLEGIKDRLMEYASKDTSILKDKVLLITGGTGSFGHAVVDRFLNTDIKEIRILSRDEKKQDDMRKAYNNTKLKFYIGDVRNLDSIIDAFKGVDYVFSAAALKQVPSCEFYPMEAVRTNVIGSDNVITACVRNGVKKAIFLSTDKAAYPINAMGISKALMEKNVIARSRQLLPGDTILCLTRYGNVMASRGSVIPLFLNQIHEGKPITITNPEMTRFMMTLDDAVDLVLYAFEHGEQGDLFVQKAPAARRSLHGGRLQQPRAAPARAGEARRGLCLLPQEHGGAAPERGRGAGKGGDKPQPGLGLPADGRSPDGTCVRCIFHWCPETCRHPPVRSS